MGASRIRVGSRFQTPARRSRGFTLVELMIVIAVIALLTAIAYPSYQDSIIRSRRKTAATCVAEAAHFMERFYTTNLRYDQTPTGTAVALPALPCATDLSGHYTVSLAGTTTQAAYSVQAVPQGNQASRDTLCGTLSLNQSGVKSESGTGDVKDCW